MLTGALTVLIFGIQTKGRTLEQIAAGEYAQTDGANGWAKTVQGNVRNEG
ncbi:hypothetical protein ACEQUB_p01142 (plasmid) [Ralstonia syzygii]|nr:hypothetical protein [Ralstonia syzygii]